MKGDQKSKKKIDIKQKKSEKKHKTPKASIRLFEIEGG